MISNNTAPPFTIVQAAYLELYAPGDKDLEIEQLEDWRDELVCLATEITLETESMASDWTRFTGLVAKWRQERGATSSIGAAVQCQSYQQIVGMGPVAVPFLIEQLRAEGDKPDQWFWALKSITGEDPVVEMYRGNFVKMAKAWIDWAEEQNAGQLVEG